MSFQFINNVQKQEVSEGGSNKMAGLLFWQVAAVTKAYCYRVPYTVHSEWASVRLWRKDDSRLRV